MSERVLHHVTFVADNVAVRALLQVSPPLAQALEDDLKRHAGRAQRPDEEERVKGVKVYAHAANALPDRSNDPAWGAHALLDKVATLLGQELTEAAPGATAYALADFIPESRELDAQAAQAAAAALWDTWSFSFVHHRGGADDTVCEEVMRLPTALRDEAEGWLGELQSWMEDTRVSYDGAIERIEAQPVSLTLNAAVAHCQEILRTHAHSDHPWLTTLADQLALTTAEARGLSAQQAPPERRRSLRRT